MRRIAPFLLLPLVAACSTVVPRTQALSPEGQTLRVIAANGQESRMQFRSDGSVVAAYGDRSFTGRWNMQSEGLCFHWGNAPVECWPYARNFERNRTTTITSTRGNIVQVTRL